MERGIQHRAPTVLMQTQGSEVTALSRQDQEPKAQQSHVQGHRWPGRGGCLLTEQLHVVWLTKVTELDPWPSDLVLALHWREVAVIPGTYRTLSSLAPPPYIKNMFLWPGRHLLFFWEKKKKKINKANIRAVFHIHHFQGRLHKEPCWLSS